MPTCERTAGKMPHRTNSALSPVTASFSNRTLFNLPKEELDSVRDEASRLLQVEWSRKGVSSLPTPPRLSTPMGFPHESRVCEERSRLIEASLGDILWGLPWTTLFCIGSLGYSTAHINTGFQLSKIPRNMVSRNPS